MSSTVTPFLDEFELANLDLEEDELERRWQRKLKTCLTFCRDPLSPATGLWELYQRASSQASYPQAGAIMSAIAQNPGINLATVRDVAYFQLELLLENPVLERLNRESPRWLDSLHGEELRVLASSAAPRLVFTPASSVETLHAFGDSLSATPEQLRVLATMSTDSSVILHVLGNPRCPAELLERAVSSGRFAQRAAVAGNPAASPALLEVLATERSWELLCTLANRSDLSVNTRALLLANLSAVLLECPDLVRSLLQGQLYQEECFALELLAQDSRLWVREGVARHPQSGAALLGRLMVDTSRRVARAARLNGGW